MIRLRIKNEEGLGDLLIGELRGIGNKQQNFFDVIDYLYFQDMIEEKTYNLIHFIQEKLNDNEAVLNRSSQKCTLLYKEIPMVDEFEMEDLARMFLRLLMHDSRLKSFQKKEDEFTEAFFSNLNRFRVDQKKVLKAALLEEKDYVRGMGLNYFVLSKDSEKEGQFNFTAYKNGVAIKQLKAQFEEKMFLDHDNQYVYIPLESGSYVSYRLEDNSWETVKNEKILSVAADGGLFIEKEGRIYYKNKKQKLYQIPLRKNEKATPVGNYLLIVPKGETEEIFMPYLVDVESNVVAPYEASVYIWEKMVEKMQKEEFDTRLVSDRICQHILLEGPDSFTRRGLTSWVSSMRKQGILTEEDGKKFTRLISLLKESGVGERDSLLEPLYDLWKKGVREGKIQSGKQGDSDLLIALCESA